MTDPVVAVLVVNYFAHESVRTLCRSLVDHRGRVELRISIVDNSQDDSEHERLLAAVGGTDAAVTVTRAPTNGGYARGNNLAWEAVASKDIEVIVVANPDAEVVGGNTGALAAEVLEKPFRLVGSRTHHASTSLTGLSVLQPVTGRSRHEELSQTAGRSVFTYPDGHFLAVGRETWEAVGGFSERYFLYGEELDLALRLRRLDASAEIVATDAVTVRHVGGESTSEHGRKSALTYLHATRSRVILYRSHARLRRFLPTLVLVRLAWAASLALKNQRSSAGSVLIGLRQGMMESIRREDSAWKSSP